MEAPIVGQKQRWHARCDCGRRRAVRSQHLVSGRSTSCGCHRTALLVSRNQTRAVHGQEPADVYRVWRSMKERCANTRCVGFRNYGGRGIAVCARWRESFEAFRDDMGPRPSGLSIDRRDNDGGYWCGHCAECVSLGHPANCRWATDAEQACNTRQTRRIQHGGRSMCIREWSRQTGIPWNTIASRLERGWDPGRAVSEPSQKLTRATR
jgi:hypothetical protein